MMRLSKIIYSNLHLSPGNVLRGPYFPSVIVSSDITIDRYLTRDRPLR